MFTNPEDAIIKKDKIESSPDDITLEPTTDKFGIGIHAMPKDFNQEVEELKQVFNTSSHEAQTIFIQKMVKAYPEEVIEFLKELRNTAPR